ncbi:MAG: hypothetical protein RLZZ262_401 [Bacteroidota bacterium]|jgi:hypothetical protein
MKALRSNPPQTVLTITVGFLVMFVIWRHEWLLKTAVIIGLIGVLSTFLSEKIEWLWMQLTKVLAFIMPNILLTIVFYVFLFPFAILARIFGSSDSLRLKNKGDSVYRVSDKKYTAQSLENPW